MLLLLSTSDTDLLCARAADVGWAVANPNRVADLDGLLSRADVVVLRILGGPRMWEDGTARVLASGKPVVMLGGEQQADAETMRRSTVPAGVAAEAHAYLSCGGPDNLRELHAFLSDALLLTGDTFAPPRLTPEWGVRERSPKDGPTVAILFYRAHQLAGNTAFVDALADAVEALGAQALPVYCASLRTAPADLLDTLRQADALITTVLAAGGSTPANAQAGGDDQDWDVGALAALDVPILQALAVTSSRARWLDSDDGLSPLDAATQVAIPEFDGRIITGPFSFKEIDADGLTVYVPDHERCARVAGIAVAHARLRHIPNADKRIALMLSAYPTKHARIGNAVGLDSPASLVALIRAMKDVGYDVGELPGVEQQDGDALMHALIAAGGQDEDWLTEEQLAANPVRISGERYTAWYATLPSDLRERIERHWGPPPGTLFTHDGGSGTDIVLAAMRANNVVVLVQPPRGFGQNPVAIYHDPDLPPSHHYLAAYYWVRSEFGAHALVHVGKHGNLEWLPGKTAALSASCGPDAAIGDLPVIYPFLVNDPGEGTQAKRRVHATIVDHLVPPMARAESYGDIARLEQLLDEHQQVAAMDPAKLPALRQQIWTLIQSAKLDHDLGLEDRPHDAEFDEMLLHVDGWLCEIKDAQIRDGLHILGLAPTGEARVNLVQCMLRARQMWGNAVALPGLREALGLVDDAASAEVDRVDALAHDLVAGMERTGWNPDEAVRLTDDPAVQGILRFAADEIIPRLDGTAGELTAVLHALDGGYIPAGPSGSPLRGLVNVLPTGRNFYAVDPRAVPSRLAWETGQAMAESLIDRYLRDEGELPRSVGLSVWGTSAMRTSGDDIAEVLALLGITPVWDEQSRRVSGLEPIPLAELGRPRIDVTVRISGFFRDAFPHVVTMLDDAVTLAAGLDEPAEMNFVKAHADADFCEHGNRRRATTRVFGSKPGAYGAGLLPLLDARTWRDDGDLAEVYAQWGGFAYGRGLDGVAARPDMETAYRRINVAAKNIDTVEHDIADSDDYFQYHGGMVATVRALTGSSPRAYVGDSTRPESVKTRTLSEEMARVFRSRVVNPKWVEGMRRHGYKGAFEMAATVDYLFGFDATAQVVEDWMYEKVTETYVLDPENKKFLQASNPWALHGIAERLLEAADRSLWASPDPSTLQALREAYLEAEGDLEGR